MAPVTRDETDFSPGASGASDSRVPGKPLWYSSGDGTITFTIDEAGNDPVVLYALRRYTEGSLDGYIQADLSIAVGEAWQTAAAWGQVTQYALTDLAAYTFDAKSKGENGNESAFGDQSEAMYTLTEVDTGIETSSDDAEEFFVTSANVYVDPTVTATGEAVPETTDTDYYGDITINYTAYGHDSDLANLQVQYSEYHGSAWDAWAAATIKTAPDGDGSTGLQTSELGTVHTAIWNGYLDAGESESCQVKFQVRLQDEAGNWSAWVETEAINYRNLPGELIFVNEGHDWDNILCPSFVATMAALRGGLVAFPILKVYEKTGLVLVQTNDSLADQTGWEYRTEAGGTWYAMGPIGIPGTAVQIRYTVQTNLTANTRYIITGVMGEVRDLS